MNKEKEPVYEGGLSEKELDLAMDQMKNQNQVKGGNIFDPAKVKKSPKDK